MKFGVIVYPGSNCDDDMIHVLGSVMGQEVEKVWHKDTNLKGFGQDDCLILPGGFSYGDYLRAGAIARFSPIMPAVIEFANKGGLVWGICNGFQVLCEAGLLPGALLRNEKRKFICKNIYLRVESKKSSLTTGLDQGTVLKIPIAHADGRYYTDADTAKSLDSNNQILFRYCDKNGQTTPKSNPNGSVDNIAGICNDRGNVIGMMPHPERAAENILGNTDGRKLFESLLSHASTPVL